MIVPSACWKGYIVCFSQDGPHIVLKLGARGPFSLGYFKKMATQFRAWSQSLLSGDGDMYTCLVENGMWRRIHTENEEAKRIFARIMVSGEEVGICALGHPVQVGSDFGDGDHSALFLPPWLLQAAGLEGVGEAIEVEWIDETYFPEATKIVLRPHECAFYHANARDELEPVLTRYGVLKVGTTIPVPIEELGGYIIQFDVIRTEPSNMVLMEGDEVAIEFERALDYVEPEAAIAAPTEPADFDTAADMFAPAAVATNGNRLGGTVRAPLKDGRPWNPWR